MRREPTITNNRVALRLTPLQSVTGTLARSPDQAAQAGAGGGNQPVSTFSKRVITLDESRLL
jgi:hypothetical protein